MSQTNTKQKLLSFIDTKSADPNVALRRLCNLVYDTAKLSCSIRSSVKGQNNEDVKHDDKETKEVRKHNCFKLDNVFLASCREDLHSSQQGL